VGGTLEDFVAQRIKIKPGYVSELFVWKVLEQLASALMHCHSGVSTTTTKKNENPPRQIQILHRNIKPGNIFFSHITTGNESNPIIKLGDFLLGPGAWTEGKFPYKPPEATNEWSESCDIFSLGCTIYYLCSLGGQPWGLSPAEELAKTQLDMAKKTLEKSPYSQDLVDIVMVCMSFDPALRPKASEINERAGDLPRPNITHWAELDWHFYGESSGGGSSGKDGGGEIDCSPRGEEASIGGEGGLRELRKAVDDRSKKEKRRGKRRG